MNVLHLCHHTKLILPKPCHSVNEAKTLFHWVNLMFNRVSQDRIKEVGPNQACAEWLLRNGAYIQWKGSQKIIQDYNELPLDKHGQREGPVLYLHSILATRASIMANGFPHFDGCQYIEKIIFDECHLINNAALPFLKLLQNSLKHLEINNCSSVSDEGILSLTALRNLEVLKFKGLQSIKNKKLVEEELKKALPNTSLSFNGK